MKNSLSFVILAVFVFSIVGVATVVATPPAVITVTNLCTMDSDCICGGTSVQSGDCFVGNIKFYTDQYVNKNAACPDFCSGIDGKSIVKCVDSKCEIVSSTTNTGSDNTTNTGTACVLEGKSYGVGGPGSPIYSCCSGLVPYSPPGFTGGATCVKPDCKMLYWLDNTNKDCSYQEFCGTYMHLGLQTFENRNDCLNALNSGSTNTTTCPVDCTCTAEITTCPVKPPLVTCPPEYFFDSAAGKCVPSAGTCTVCIGGNPTGARDSSGCPIYSCPSLNTTACNKGFVVDPSSGKCVPQISTCPVGCTCNSETITCPARPPLVACPVNCNCDSTGKILECSKTTSTSSGGLELTTNVTTGNVVDYYKSKLDTTMAVNNSDAKIQALSDLRKEIDETIKNLIEQKKTLSFSDVKNVASNVVVTPTTVQVGEATASSEGVTINTELSGGSVTVASSTSSVVVSQDNLNVTSGNITIDANGLKVDGASVKLSPKDALEQNHNFASGTQQVTAMTLGKQGDTAIYTAQYQTQKKILGIVPATASQQLTIDASSGQTISEKGPWWGFIATNAGK